MNEPKVFPQPSNLTDATARVDNGQTAADQQLDRWERAKFLMRAIEVRLRFIALFVGIGLLMAYWRTIENYWDRWTRTDSGAATAEANTEYYCPMHPSVVRPGLEPNGAVPNCPICGMPLSKRKKSEISTLPQGVTARVQLSPERVKLAGIEVATASYMPLSKEVRTVGYVAYDEGLLSEIVTRVSGYVERLYIDKTYVTVKEGEPLAELYSPELYSGVRELLLAQKHGAADLVESSRKRLKLLGISDAEVDETLASSDDRTRLLIRSTQSGQVVEKNVVVGASLKSGATLFKIADLSEVWIETDVFEKELPFLHVGQEVEATVEALPGKVFHGEVLLIYPELNRETRTGRIRVSVANPELQLRPGMYATVTIRSPMSETEPFRTRLARKQSASKLSEQDFIARQRICPITGAELGSMKKPVRAQVGEQTVFLCCEGCEKALREDPAKYLARLAPPPQDAVLSIPEQAVVDTGTMKVVYLEKEPGLYEGVQVELGPRSGGFYPVLSGLSPGDRIAAAGSFLLDAETRLNPGAASAYFGASGGPSTAGTQNGSSAVTLSGGAPAAAKKMPSPQDLENIDKLPPEDRALARLQAVCPVTDEPLGFMGVPLKFMVKGVPVFVCCPGCEQQLREQPDKILEMVGRSRPPIEKDASILTAPSSVGGQNAAER